MTYFNQIRTHQTGKLSGLPQEDQDFFQQMMELSNFRGSSDSFLLYAQLSDEREKYKALNAIRIILHVVAMTTALKLAQGVPIRGGIEIGQCINLEDDEIYGRAIVEAYELESKFAEYPRILVGRELCAFLNDMKNQNTTTKLGVSVKRIAKEILQYIIQDSDYLFMLDFLALGLKAMRDDRDLDKTIAKDGYRFVVREHKRFITEGDFKLASRYGRLRTYYESRLNLWDIAIDDFRD